MSTKAATKKIVVAGGNGFLGTTPPIPSTLLKLTTI
jgi:hypothetical protein